MITFDAHALIKNLFEASVLVQDFSIIAGITLFFMGIFKFKRYAQMRTFMSEQMTIAGPLTLILCGALLVMSPILIGTLSAAFWGQSAVNAYPDSSIPELRNLEEAVIIFVRFIGVCAFIRGWIILARSGSINTPPGQRGKALMHIFSSLLLIHILLTMNLIESAFGFIS